MPNSSDKFTGDINRSGNQIGGSCTEATGCGSNPDSDPRPPNKIVIFGEGDLADYEFTVSGELEGDQSTLDENDNINGNSADGLVGGSGSDTYYFSGDVTDFTHDGPLSIEVNGEPYDPDSDPNPGDLPYEIVVKGRSGLGSANYTFSTTDEIQETSSVENGEGTTSSGVSAFVGENDTDRYRFSGDLNYFQSDGAVRIEINDYWVTDGTYANQITVNGRDGQGSANYTFSSSGDERETSSVESDEGTTSTGVTASVSETDTDTYEFSGELNYFQSDGAVNLDISGK
jgi:hypothetical protein